MLLREVRSLDLEDRRAIRGVEGCSRSASFPLQQRTFFILEKCILIGIGLTFRSAELAIASEYFGAISVSEDKIACGPASFLDEL